MPEVTSDLTIKNIEFIKELPSLPLRGYSLDKQYTEKVAARDYELFYRVPPKMGWRWGDYLYLALPEAKA